MEWKGSLLFLLVSTPSNEIVLIIYTFIIFENINILTIFLPFVEKRAGGTQGRGACPHKRDIRMLTKVQLNDIKALQKVCENEGGFQLKLNFEMLKNRVEYKTEDFFHYEDGRLVGFLGSYGFGNKVELNLFWNSLTL